MAYKTEHFEEAVNLIRRLPNGTWFDIDSRGRTIQLQVRNRAEFRQIRSGFPGVVWLKTWRDETQWWEFDSKVEGWKIHIYACREAGHTCRAITEKRMVKVKVPTNFVEREEEKTVIVGWDCGPIIEPAEETSSV